MTGYPIEDARSQPGAGTPSREVKFYPVYEMLSPMLADPRLIPGTPVWCQLDDADPAKWQAILWSAVWWAIAEECRQDAIAEAGEQIAAAEDWGDVARQVQRRRQIDEHRRAS